MKVIVVGEPGFVPALFGLGLSYGKTSDLCVGEFSVLTERYEAMKAVALRLAGKGKGHDKFLRQMFIWLDIKAPLFWWKEMDQYRIGVTSQSESTMHTLLKTPITQECFAYPIGENTLARLEGLRLVKDFDRLVNELPQGWLQRRIVSANYAVLRNIIEQRRNHRLPQWPLFISEIREQVVHPEFLFPEEVRA